MRDLRFELLGDAGVAPPRHERADPCAGGGDGDRKAEDGAAEEAPGTAVPSSLARRDVVRLPPVDVAVAVADDETGIVEAELALRGDGRGVDDRVPRRLLIVEHGDNEHVGHRAHVTGARGEVSSPRWSDAGSSRGARASSPSNPQGGAFFVFVASDYPFLDVFWTMIIFFLWVIWIWFLIAILSDVFRRQDIGGGKKAVWTVFIIFLPIAGALAYLIVNGQGMAQRNVKQAEVAQSQTDEYIRSVAGSSGATGEIERAKQLLDSGAINADEYASLKAKALAGGTA